MYAPACRQSCQRPGRRFSYLPYGVPHFMSLFLSSATALSTPIYTLPGYTGGGRRRARTLRSDGVGRLLLGLLALFAVRFSALRSAPSFVPLLEPFAPLLAPFMCAVAPSR